MSADIGTDNIEPTTEEIAAEPLLQLFRWQHLKDETLRGISRQFCNLARRMLALPRNQERTAALRFLRQAKDCAVTAQLWQQPPA